MRKIVLLCILFLDMNTLYAQSLYEKMCLANEIDSNYLQLIDKTKLKKLLAAEDAELYLVSIFTNYCDGSKYLLKNIKKLEETYPNKVKNIFCSSAPYSEIKDYLNKLKSFNISTKPVYIIDSSKYKEDPEDDREKGTRFRNKVCRRCKRIIIGVPFILLYNKEGKLLAKGYASYMKEIEKYLNK